MGDFEILEHTADIGLRARGLNLEETFEQATRGFAEIAGIWAPAGGDEVAIDVTSGDLEALLVEWLSEVLYLHETRDAALAGVELASVDDGRATGTLTLTPLGKEPSEGVPIKAITYHQLKIERTSDGYSAEVFFDI